VRELQVKRARRLAWRESDAPTLEKRGDTIVRPFVAGRCDGDTLAIHRPVSRALRAGIALRLVDPVLGCICGAVPFKGPFAIGHECLAEVAAVQRLLAAGSTGLCRVFSYSGSGARATPLGQAIVPASGSTWTRAK
jgi:hypothetical protein